MKQKKRLCCLVVLPFQQTRREMEKKKTLKDKQIHEPCEKTKKKAMKHKG